MKKRIIWAVLIIAVVAGFAYLRLTAINRAKYVHVKAEKAVKGKLYAYLSTSGTVESEVVKNYFGTQGKVKEIYVHVGDQVKKGATLASYEVQDMTSMVKQAELQYENAKLSYEELKNQKKSSSKQTTPTNTGTADNQMLQQLLGGSSGQSATVSEERLKQAKNSVELARLAYANAKENLKKVKDKIVAEAEGIVTKINISEGAVDSGMQPAIVVQDLNKLKIESKVGRFDSYKIRKGMQVIIRNNDNNYKGIVSFIDPVANQQMSVTGTDTSMGMEIKVLTGVKALKVGFDTDIDILYAAAADVVKVPAESVKTDKNENAYVFVVDGEKALKKDVKLGIQSDTEVEIKQGLSEGDKVILNPSSNVSEGTLVKVDAEVNGK